MTRRTTTEDTDDDVADSQAQIESLQAAAADAEARAATAREELAEARRQAAGVEAQLARVSDERESAYSELARTREALSLAQTAVREAAAKYRAAVLAADPDIPGELVPEAEDIEEIDRGLESARNLVGRVRERLEEATAEQARSLQVPGGAPVRRAPDVSGLSAEEKIRLGLQQAAEREGR